MQSTIKAYNRFNDKHETRPRHKVYMKHKYISTDAYKKK